MGLDLSGGFDSSPAADALLMQSDQLGAQLEGAGSSLAARQITNARLSDRTSFGDLNLRHVCARQVGDQRLPVHRFAPKHRIADIVPTGLPIVNMGRLGAMEQTERKRTEFGKRMLAARKAVKPKELTQAYVCEQLGMRQSTLSELETNAHGSSKTTEFAKLYGVDPHWLATGEGNMRPGGASAKPSRNFEDRRVVSPSQWALLRAAEDLLADSEKKELVSRHERVIDRLRQTAEEVRGLSMPADLDEAEEEPPTTNKRGKKR